MSVTIRFGQDVLDSIVDHARTQAPLEACGLFGARNDCVCLALGLTNVLASPHRFRLDPVEQIAAQRAFRDRGLTLCGVYHSHLATSAQPSVDDISQAQGVPGLHLIVSLAGGCPDMRLYGAQYAQNLPLVLA